MSSPQSRSQNDVATLQKDSEAHSNDPAIASSSGSTDKNTAETSQKEFLLMSGESVWPSLLKGCHTIRDAREAITRDQTVSRGEEVRIKLMLDDKLLSDDQEISTLPGSTIHVAVEAVWDEDLKAKITDWFKYVDGDGWADRRARLYIEESWPNIFGIEFCDPRLPEHTTKTQQGLLHFAAQLDRPKVVNDLLELRANVNVEDKCGRTPLDYAIEHRRFSCSRSLHKAGGKAQDQIYGNISSWVLEAFFFNPWLQNIQFAFFFLMVFSSVAPLGAWMLGYD